MRSDHPLRRRCARAIVCLLTSVTVLSMGCTRNSSDDNSDAQGGAVSAEAVDTFEITFTDVSKDAGLHAVQSPWKTYGDDSMTSGVAVADVNGDGFDDIFLTRVASSNVLYLNNGDGTFADVTATAGLAEAEPTYGSSAAAFFDADGDGNLDLFVTTFGRGQNRLYMNDGHGTFTEQTAERGITFPPLPSLTDVAQMHGVTVGDVNGDGYLDLLVLQWFTEGLLGEISTVYELAGERGIEDPMSLGACQLAELIYDLEAEGELGRVSDSLSEAMRFGSHSKLFLNDGTGHFVDATQTMGLDFTKVIAFTGVFVDYDGDGWQDLAVTGDGCTSKLYRNVDGQRFEDVTDDAGVGTDENGMGSVFTDLNGDGLPDWVISAISYGEYGKPCVVGGSLIGCSGNRVFLNDGAGGFEEVANDLGLRDGGWGWGLAIEDFANIGSEQVVMTNGYLNLKADQDVPVDEGSDPFTMFMRNFNRDSTRFWMAGSNGTFVDVAERVGITDTGLGHALVPFDFNDDGRLDILIAESHAPPILYRNDTVASRAWLTIRLDDPTSRGNRVLRI